MSAIGDEWLWGWDHTPGIVSVHATQDGRAIVWRRITETDALIREEVRFRPWMLLRHLGDVGNPSAGMRYRKLEGPGALRYLVSADDGRALVSAVLRGASERLGKRAGNLRELGQENVLSLPPEEQYLVEIGRAHV